MGLKFFEGRVLRLADLSVRKTCHSCLALQSLAAEGNSPLPHCNEQSSPESPTAGGSSIPPMRNPERKT